VIYDAVLCVSSKHKQIALRAIRSLHVFTRPRKIFVITSTKNFAFFEDHFEAQAPILLLDEDKLIDNVDLRFIKSELRKRSASHKRAGWYYQQFLKMAACNLSEVADHYLIWDSDTILLQPLDFFDGNGRVLINPKTEDHRPYFNLMAKAVGVKKQVDFSFISEHFMINTMQMKHLISSIEQRSPGNALWAKKILDAIDNKDLQQSGFSEYETYGNFIAQNYKESFRCRPIKSTRNGAKIYGRIPNRYDLFSLMQAGYAFATFESWHSATGTQLATNKTISRLRHLVARLTRHCIERRNAAAQICR
jgi:hypothetical protein